MIEILADLMQRSADCNPDSLAICHRSESASYANLCGATEAFLAKLRQTFPNDELQKIHLFANIDPIPFSGYFDQTEHHILGNSMRLQDGEIRLDDRWENELGSRHIEQVTSLLLNAAERGVNDQLGSITEQYLGSRQV